MARAEAQRAMLVGARWRRPVRAWLGAMAALVALMVLVGGATRLTDSGLSITEWQPLLGAIPPLNEADWQAAFAKYKAIPQAAIVNKDMTLAGFKAIYWWEWAHRQLGRGIGLAFALPLVLFLIKGALSRAMAARLAGILALGALQGAAGWYMVKSGLVERIDVSPYRLALHLGLAVLILTALLRTALELGGEDRQRVAAPPLYAGQRLLSALLPVAVFVQIVLGAFVAGHKAGRAYNTWPLMDGQWVPDAIGALRPWYLNITENMTTVQFDHRLAAYVVLALALWHAIAVVVRNGPGSGLARSAGLVAAAVLAQVGIGIWTVLRAVPIELGLLHQAGALAVLALALWHRHRVVAALAPGQLAPGIEPPRFDAGLKNVRAIQKNNG